MKARRDHGLFSMEKRGKRWSCQVNLGTNPVTGKRMRKRFTADTKAEARNLGEAYKKQFDRGIDIDGGNELTAIFLDKWFDSYQSKRELRTSSVQRYQEELNHFINQFGDVPIKLVTPTHLDGFIRSGIGRTTLYKSYNLVKKAFGDAVKYDLLQSSPFWKHEGPKKPVPDEARYLTVEEVIALLDALEGAYIEDMVKFMLRSGARVGEVIGLEWDDITWNEDGTGIANIKRSVRTNMSEGIVVSPPKTKSGRRRIELNAPTMEVLKSQQLKNQARQIASTRYEDHGLVFPSRVGTYFYQRNILKELKKAAKAAGLEDVVNHTMRHSHATLAILNKSDLFSLSRRMGHSSIKVTSDLYGHLTDGMQDQAADALDAVLKVESAS